MRITRAERRKGSNNATDPNKNVCALHVAYALGVHNKVTYLHTVADLHRAARKRFSVRSVKSMVKGQTVGAVRSSLAAIGAIAYIVIVEGHTLLLDNKGKTLVDTAPRSRDRRKIVKIHGVYPKEPKRRRKSRHMVLIEKMIEERKRINKSLPDVNTLHVW